MNTRQNGMVAVRTTGRSGIVRITALHRYDSDSCIRTH